MPTGRRVSIDPHPEIDEAAIAQTAKQATFAWRILSYVVLAMTVVIGGVAVVVLRSGAAGHLWLSIGLIACMGLGTGLFWNYLATRHRAYADALAAHRRKAVAEYWNRRRLAGPTIVGTLIALVFGARSLVNGFRLGAGGRALTREGLMVLIVFGAVAITAFVLALLWRSIGWVRTLSLAQIIGSLIFGLAGIEVAQRERVEAEMNAAAEEKNAAAAAVREKAAAEGLADANIMRRCIAARNVGAVQYAIKTHGRDRIAFVEIEIAQMTNEQKSKLGDELSSIPGFTGANQSDDKRAMEVVCAPIDDLTKLAAGLAAYKIVSTNASVRRIKVEPDTARLQGKVDRDKNQAEFNELSTMGGGWEQVQSFIRAEHGRERVAAVDVLHSTSGIGRAETAVYQRLKPHAQVLRISRLGNNAQRYFLKYDKDNVEELARKLDFGTLVDIDGFERIVTVDLATVKAKPYSLKPPRKLGDAMVVGGMQQDVDLNELKKIYGDKLIEVNLDRMPNDPAERDFLRRRMRSGVELCRCYYALNDLAAQRETYLIVPLDDIEAFKRRHAFLVAKPGSNQKQHLYFSVDIEQLRHAMRQPAK